MDATSTSFPVSQMELLRSGLRYIIDSFTVVVSRTSEPRPLLLILLLDALSLSLCLVYTMIATATGYGDCGLLRRRDGDDDACRECGR